MPSILFICTANRFRSPLAAAIMKKNLEEMHLADAWQIASAGTWAQPGQPVLAGVLPAAQSVGVNLTAHRSARLNRDMLLNYDLLVVMEAGHKEALLSEIPELEERLFLLSYLVERRSYDIPDAIGSEQEIRELAAELDSLLRRGLTSICVMATYLYNSRHRQPQ